MSPGMSAEMQSGKRADGRGAQQLRRIRIERGVLTHALGSALIRIGRTQVLCAATLDERAPVWLRGKGHGWVTAEYGMLPCAVPDRAARGRVSGRNFEIQRLIGRSLRAVVDLSALREWTITVDCDVLEADGGTRVASITGGWVALHEAFEKLRAQGKIPSNPIKGRVAAVSVALVNGVPLIDPTHPEDSAAQLDLNVVGTEDGRLVEVQGAAEGEPFAEEDLRKMIRTGRRGLARLFRAQDAALARAPRKGMPLLGGATGA